MADDVNEAARVLRAYIEAGKMIATAESCTGGLIAGALTDIAGSSAVVDRGFVTYSNAAKTEMLGVSRALIEAHGAVSAVVAAAMAQGAIDASRADVAIAVTGIAGPDGGSAEKPVGTVWFGRCQRGKPPETFVHVFEGQTRKGVRDATVQTALKSLLEVA